MKSKIRRFKIAEQMIIVIFIAVLIPLGISTAIITNVNQQAVREELKTSAVLSANSVQQYFSAKIKSKLDVARNIATLRNYPYYKNQMDSYLEKISKNDSEIKSIQIVSKKTSMVNADNAYAVFYDGIDRVISIFYKINSRKYVLINLDAQKIDENAVKDFADIQRDIYIFDDENNVIIPAGYDKNYLDKMLQGMPNDIPENETILFFSKKNQPNAIIKIPDIGWKVVVTTPKFRTKYGITKARYKIIFIIIAAAGAIIFLCSIYLLSLYTNIRQLFKAINAVADGNYGRKVRLITNFMTPYEVIFLSKEFNKMVKRIKYSYRELKKNNIKLEQLGSFKSNLIDTVSHELRTPLTSIKGYTSRLLRQDVAIDENIRQDSLKVIKRQAERLSRMVDDLLVIPDIESSAIKVLSEEVSLKNTIENVLVSISYNQSKKFNVDMPEELGDVYADSDRVEQVVTNLLENAMKYSFEDEDIDIKVRQLENDVEVSIINKCKTIEKEKLRKLFDKFTRVEDSTTRTTRGTGLGLFIVKGLIEAMKGYISLSSDNDFRVTFTLPLVK